MLTLHEDRSGIGGVGTCWRRMALPRVAVWRIVRMMRMDLKNPPTTVERRLKRRIARVLRKALQAFVRCVLDGL